MRDSGRTIRLLPSVARPSWRASSSLTFSSFLPVREAWTRLWSRIRFLRPFGVRDSESLMNLAHLGVLECICKGPHVAPGALDQRQFCRSCGHLIRVADPALLTAVLSASEITARVMQLKEAGIMARRLELPNTLKSVEGVLVYLRSKSSRGSAEKGSGPETVPDVRLI